MNARTYFNCTVSGCGLPHDAKGFCRSHYKRWKLHGDPLIQKRQPNGTGYIGRKGHKLLNVNGRKTSEHRLIVESVLGKTLPKGAQIHHADGNPLNNEKSNLAVCPNAGYHQYLHMRIRARDACGNPNWMRCPFCKKYDDKKNMRGEKSGRFVHAECSNAVNRKKESVCHTI